jgi:pimeloyl-ACP methyl ester carboxylesterase
VFGFARGPMVVMAALLFPVLGLSSFAAEGAIANHASTAPSYILIGFAGGFINHDNPHHGPVVLAKRIQGKFAKDAYVQVFENRHRKKALKTILHLLDTNHDGILTDQEKSRARLILFGHSWGASAAVLLARELDNLEIPVLLTVQVDSVAKFWQRDDVIPDNVAAAVNFYQPHGLLHGRSVIRAADDSKTQILGNYRFDYRQNPVRCEASSWFDRTFTPSHMQSQCDPHIWTQVEDLVRRRMETPADVLATLPTR